MAQDSREVHHVGGLICCAGIVLAVQYVFMDYVENYIETHFSTLSGLRWLDQHWYISWTCSVAYVALLYLGAKWMKHRKPYNLRRPLLMWNMALAIFSIATFWRSEVPKVAEKLFTEGIEEVSCRSTSFDNPKHLVWIFLFTVFKVVELGDTAFIVLRKTPLNFLHWYHHITVLVYSWYIVPQRPASAIMFLAMNSAVHSIMYSYYAVKAAGYRVPSQLAMIITILQILQMIGGMAFNITAFKVLQKGENCQFSYQLFVYGMIIYTSYFILFGNFFYRRYISQRL